MSTINKISDTNQPVPEGLREAARRAAPYVWKAVWKDLPKLEGDLDRMADAITEHLAPLFAQPAPVAVGGEGKLREAITQVINDMVAMRYDHRADIVTRLLTAIAPFVAQEAEEKSAEQALWKLYAAVISHSEVTIARTPKGYFVMELGKTGPSHSERRLDDLLRSYGTKKACAPQPSPPSVQQMAGGAQEEHQKSVPPAAETGSRPIAFSVLAGHLKYDEVVILKSQYDALERENAQLRASCDKWLDAEHEARATLARTQEELANEKGQWELEARNAGRLTVELSQAVSQRDEARDQLSAANSALDEAKLKYVRREFIARMDAELIANERKGDWDAYRPKRFDTCAWMTEHTNKLWDALREHDRVKVSEFCADIANIAMKIDVTFGAKQEDIDAARLSQGKQEGGVTK